MIASERAIEWLGFRLKTADSSPKTTLDESEQARATLANFINPAFRNGCDSIVVLEPKGRWV